MSVGVGRVGVEDGSGVASMVASAEVSTAAGGGSGVDPALHPEIMKMTSRQMMMHNFLSEMIDFIRRSPSVAIREIILHQIGGLELFRKILPALSSQNSWHSS